jgi:hypothetical protein
MIKPVNEVFKEQFWRELQASHKAAQEKREKITVESANQDAVILHLRGKDERKHTAD